MPKKRHLAVAIVAAFLHTIVTMPLQAARASNGLTETYVFGNFHKNFFGSVIVTLPARPKNTSWFTNWIMLVSKRRLRSGAPFVQVGEIRYLNPTKYPSAFVAYVVPGENVVYLDLGRVSEKEHVLRIDGNERTLALAFDGHVLKRFRRATFFGERERTYFQIGSEVNRSGDEPSGYLRHIEVKKDEQSFARSMNPTCIKYDRGLDLAVAHNKYIPQGSYQPRSPSGFRHCLLGENY